MYLPLAHVLYALYIQWIGWGGGIGRWRLDINITRWDVQFFWCDGNVDISACGGDISLGIVRNSWRAVVRGRSIVGWCWLCADCEAGIGLCGGGYLEQSYFFYFAPNRKNWKIQCSISGQIWPTSCWASIANLYMESWVENRSFLTPLKVFDLNLYDIDYEFSPEMDGYHFVKTQDLKEM